jgi:hypothetical protein
VQVRQLLMFKDFVLMLAFLLPVSCFAASPGYQVSETVPVPAIIGLATTAFYSFTGSPVNLGSVNVKLAYEAVYRALRKNGHYQLVSIPSDAEIFLELSVQERNGDVTGGSSFNTPGLQLRLVDRKTQAILWSIAEPIANGRKSALAKNVDAAANQLIADLDSLIHAQVPTDGLPK